MEGRRYHCLDPSEDAAARAARGQSAAHGDHVGAAGARRRSRCGAAAGCRSGPGTTVSAVDVPALVSASRNPRGVDAARGWPPRRIPAPTGSAATATSRCLRSTACTAAYMSRISTSTRRPEWDNKSAEDTAERERQRQLEAATVAFLEPGDPQRRTRVQPAGGEHDRSRALTSAPAGARARWFSFAMPVDPVRPNAIVVTYHADSRRPANVRHPD